MHPGSDMCCIEEREQMHRRPVPTELSMSLQMKNLAQSCDCSGCAHHPLDSMNRTYSAATQRNETNTRCCTLAIMVCFGAAFFIVNVITCHQYSTQQQILELVLLKWYMHNMCISPSVRLIDAAVASGGSYLSGASDHVDQLNQMSQCLAVGLPCWWP